MRAHQVSIHPPHLSIMFAPSLCRVHSQSGPSLSVLVRPLVSFWRLLPTKNTILFCCVCCCYFSSDQPISTPFGCLVIITPYPVVMYCPLVAYIYINACLPRKTQHQCILNRSKEHSGACCSSLVVITFPHDVSNL